MKRALIVTYYWPPAGGPGVQRWLNFVKHLNDFDVEPIVYIPENPHYPIIDTAFSEKAPWDIEIIKRPIKEPYGWANLFLRKKTKRISSGIITENKPSFIERAMLYVRGNYFIPDARIGWVKPSVNFLENYLSQKPVDVIITTGPPHSMHLIGLQLKKKTGIKWIADFRDPWTSIHYHRSLHLTDSSAKKHKELEADVLNSVDSVIVTSPTTRKEFSKITESRIHIITNGYEIEAPIIAQPDDKFTLAHIGSLLSDRNPELLWEVLAELTYEREGFLSKLEIKLVGAVSDDVIRSLEKYGLKSNTNIVGYVNHSEAKQLQHNARVLLLLENHSWKTFRIPCC